MHNVISMSSEFERQKNMQASAITGGISGALLLLFILVRWTIPINTPPPVDDYISVNLGSSNDGMGADQPQLPGDPAPAEQTAYTPPQSAEAHEEAAKDLPDEQDNDAAPVIKPSVTRPDAKKINTETKVVKTNNPTPAPPVVTPPRPRAVLGHTIGGNGNGGNGADTYKPGTGEGTTGRPGDQGVPGGDPNGTRYTGTPKSFGVREFSIPNQSFEDDFNQNAKIAMDIVTNSDGKVISATYTSKGSTGTATAGMINIAKRRAFELKVGPDMKGTVIFNFKVR